MHAQLQQTRAQRRRWEWRRTQPRSGACEHGAGLVGAMLAAERAGRACGCWRIIRRVHRRSPSASHAPAPRHGLLRRGRRRQRRRAPALACGVWRRACLGEMWGFGGRATDQSCGTGRWQRRYSTSTNSRRESGRRLASPACAAITASFLPATGSSPLAGAPPRDTCPSRRPERTRPPKGSCLVARRPLHRPKWDWGRGGGWCRGLTAMACQRRWGRGLAGGGWLLAAMRRTRPS